MVIDSLKKLRRPIKGTAYYTRDVIDEDVKVLAAFESKQMYIKKQIF
jgi:hypothetical protein